MLMRFFRKARFSILLRCAPAFVAGFLMLVASPLGAQTFTPTLTVGAGIQTSYDHTEPDTGTSLDQFSLNHLRLYFSGDITPYLSAMVNTEYTSSSNTMGVLDAVGEFHTSPMFNVWFGRFIAPSDRANLYGPFYSNEWAVYSDGIQDGYPSVLVGGVSPTGRDNGVAYWGDFKAGTVKLKLSAGAFDGLTTDGSHSVIWAARAQFDFWDPENGYYLNGTYYGDKNLLAIGGATEVQDYKTATTVDFLLEKKVLNGGAFTVESEYSRYNRLGGYDGSYAKSEGGYGLVSLLLPKEIGVGKPQIIGKFAIAEFTDGLASPATNPSYRQKTTEVDFGYIMKQFDARVYAFGKVTDLNHPANSDFWDAGVGLQFQLSKQIMGAK